MFNNCINRPLFVAIFFVIFLFFPKVILATPTLNITKFPESQKLEELFLVEVVFVGLEPKEKYFIKAVGGENWYDTKTWSDKAGKWLAWNGAWDEMPETIALDDGSEISTISAKFIETTILGGNLFKIKIVKSNDTSKPFYSNPVTINVLPTPTPEPTASPTPTGEPDPTNTPVPIITSTPTPSKPLNIPTVTPTKKPTATPTPKITPTAETEFVLAAATTLTPAASPTVTPTVSENKSPSIFLPFILVGAGLLFLTVSGVLLLKNKNEGYN